MNTALGIVIRTSVLLACVSLIAFALRRASASVRHALWVAGLLAVLVFPVASRMLPEWNWAILPEKAPASKSFDTTPPPVSAISASAPLRDASLVSAPAQAVAVNPPRTLPTQNLPMQKWTWEHWCALLWALGSCVFVLGWMKSVWDLRRLAQRSQTISDGALAACLMQAQRAIDVSGTIQLRIAADSIPPMTWGIFRHVILLPAAAIQWLPVRQRLVLAHELAHVKRNDSVGQILAQVVCSIYWFNPLVWYAVRRLHAERERACDDSVLRLGADGADYADHLLQIARGLNAGFAQSAVSMAHPSQLKSRLMAILDSGMRRSRASRIAATSLLTIVSVLMLTIAAVQVTTLSSLALPALAAPLRAPLWSPAPAAQAPVTAIDSHIEFLSRYCVSCHNESQRVARLVFDFKSLDTGGATKDRPRWEKAVQRLRAGMDPPVSATAPRPPEAAIQSMIQFLESELDRNAKVYVPAIGPHRLNRTEYANAIRDLLDLEIDVTKLLPGDDYDHGFDKVGFTSEDQQKAAEPYVAIAPFVSRLAIQAGPNSSSFQRIFVCRSESTNGTAPSVCARQIGTALIETAFRGLGTPADVDAFVATYNATSFYPFDQKIGPAVAQVLASPKFLFRTEEAPANVKAGEAYRVSDLALASRLAFFLWSTVPDRELIDVAKQGKLHDPVVLEQQTMRMLKDYRAETLASNFAGQWLGTRWVTLPEIAPSPLFFPEFDEPLRQDMLREANMFFESIVREDRNVVDLLTANDTYVNNRLAHFYGIPNVSGNQFRRITLPAEMDARRGILGKAAFLSITNNYAANNRTSVVGRGRWVMHTLLGIDPPPPPPNAPPLRNRSTDPKAPEPSLRKDMEDHKYNPSCVSCHRYIDPIGYSLENFNAIGMWRANDGGAPINAADTLYDGTAINGPSDLRRWLAGRSDQFVQTMTERLMTYALGRGVEAQDMPLIRAIDREAARNNNRFSAIVLGIVKSDAFQMNSK